MSVSHTCQSLRTFTSRSSWVCSLCLQSLTRQKFREKSWRASPLQARGLQTESSGTDKVPFRKQLKDEARQRRAAEGSAAGKVKRDTDARLGRWELTVGIEVHAQLNTDRKLFSRAATSINDPPNSHVSIFDLAFPGSQPEFQNATLIPALRAATALNCNVQRVSKFDRKHYFYQDQPAGYQITQYYEPFAKDGSITLYDHDGIAPEDGRVIEIGIKQIQMEQDTAKTILQPPDTMLLDFNRVGHPLIEIITLPQIHHPQTAAACVRKLQAILQAVNAVTTGMEMGGLRADVNVSVRPRNSGPGTHSYYGITGLGQRTEIKNLSSFKAVEDAVIAERDRQINVLESGGVIDGETRGWALGSTETRKLRGKEGEVDYRYMPDPDLAPVIIAGELVQHITKTLPVLPDDKISSLVKDLYLSVKDAKTLVALDNGERLDYFDAVLSSLSTRTDGLVKYGKTTANWILHELGGLLSTSEKPFSEHRVTAEAMASIIHNLLENRITGRTAKQLLFMAFGGDIRDIEMIIREEGLELHDLSRDEYKAMASKLIAENDDMVQKIRQKGQIGKLKWFVGQMMRQGEGKVVAETAEDVLKEMLGLDAADQK